MELIENQIMQIIKKSERITVFTGAGISTNCGIPDFRSENGLYSFVEKQYSLPYPEAIFEISFFRKNPKPFFQLSKTLLGNKIQPTPTHHFIALLEQLNKIAIVVTQNIDNLHNRAGSRNVLECHGTYQTARCLECAKTYTLNDITNDIENDRIPFCKCGGIIKPDIVFFNEMLPKRFYDVYNNPPRTDLLIVMGTSLTVQPAAGFALNIAQNTASIFINNCETAYDNAFTYKIESDTDSFSVKAMNFLGNS